jgi:hypothetical protein
MVQIPSRVRRTAAVAILVLAGMTAGCTSQLADLGEPAETPPRPATEPAYPAVHDMPAARDTKPLTAEERRRLMDDLSAARERQEAETAEAADGKKPSGTQSRPQNGAPAVPSP